MIVTSSKNEPVALPIMMREVDPTTNIYQTMNPGPFSNNAMPITGEYKYKVRDRTAFDDPDSKDKIKYEAKFTSPIDKNGVIHEYILKVNKIIPVGDDHTFMGGVGTNFVHHGMTGIGTPLMPTSNTFVAFWGVATLTVDGEEVADDRLAHLMTTCRVRDADYKLVFEGEDDCSKVHTHILLPPVRVEENQDGTFEFFGSVMNPMEEPTPTKFILPNEMMQPFLHIMFENIEIEGIKTKIGS